MLLPPVATPPTADIETLQLDRGYDNSIVQACAQSWASMIWTVERPNSWMSNFGQLRRNPDRYIYHRLAQIALAVTLVIIVELVKMGGPLEPDNLTPGRVRS